MTIDKIANPKKDVPPEVFADPEMDQLRRERCLCYNCDHMNDDPPYSGCPAAAALYKVSCDHDMAMMITRCGAVDEDGMLLYRPLEK